MKLYGAASATFPPLPFPPTHSPAFIGVLQKRWNFEGEKRRETEAKKEERKSENPTFSSGFSSFSFLSP